jgi:hypothetical protein
MSAEHATRTLLGPADPARDVAVAPPRRSARDLILRAEATPSHRPTRRLVLVAGAAGVVVLAAGTVAVLRPSGPSTVDGLGPPIGLVLLPIAYQYDTGAPSAAAHLRALADTIGDAPNDVHTGRYAYHDVTFWGDPVESAGNGRYVMAFASNEKVWQLPDGTGKQIDTQLQPQFPDKASQEYWTHSQALPTDIGTPHTVSLPPLDIPPLPTDLAGLRTLLDVTYGAGQVCKDMGTIYAQYAVPREIRAQILRVLADVPGFVWRGTVTDRAGRTGVAITHDDPQWGQQELLVFDPKTGALLANELLTLSPKRISTYQLILATDRTDTVG